MLALCWTHLRKKLNFGCALIGWKHWYFFKKKDTFATCSALSVVRNNAASPLFVIIFHFSQKLISISRLPPPIHSTWWSSLGEQLALYEFEKSFEESNRGSVPNTVHFPRNRAEIFYQIASEILCQLDWNICGVGMWSVICKKGIRIDFSKHEFF